MDPYLYEEDQWNQTKGMVEFKFKNLIFFLDFLRPPIINGHPLMVILLTLESNCLLKGQNGERTKTEVQMEGQTNGRYQTYYL